MKGYCILDPNGKMIMGTVAKRRADAIMLFLIDIQDRRGLESHRPRGAKLYRKQNIAWQTDRKRGFSAAKIEVVFR